MEILIGAGVFSLFVLALTVKTQKSEKVRIAGQVARINTLLQNIEVYDGSPRGQKKPGGDMK